eukprot:2034291-Pleurochrysis_carterae.AAC.1
MPPSSPCYYDPSLIFGPEQNPSSELVAAGSCVDDKGAEYCANPDTMYKCDYRGSFWRDCQRSCKACFVPPSPPPPLPCDPRPQPP